MTCRLGLKFSFFLILLQVQTFCFSRPKIRGTVSFEVLNPDYNVDKIAVVGSILDHKRSYIVFIQDKDDNLFLIKQSRESKPANKSGPLMHAREMLAGYIAESNGVPANRIRILPAGYPFPGKLYTKRPATFHTVVPGKNCKDYPFIQQTCEKAVPQEQWGLKYKVIQDMSTHQDLPLIVALDSFIANGGRRNGSFFYDQKNDRYWAIDLESLWKTNIAELACKLINTLLNDTLFKPTPEELSGLILYRDTLKKMNERHPPDVLHMKLDEFLVQAGIVPGAPFFDDEVVQVIQYYKKSISESYASCLKLVESLDKLIAYHQSNKNLGKLKYSQLHKEQERSDSGAHYSGTQLDDYIADRLQAYKCALFAHE